MSQAAACTYGDANDDTTTIAISILVYIAIGNYAGRGVKKLDDYYVAGRRAPTLVIVGTLVASLMSSTMFLGEAGFAYEGQAGPYVIWPQTACIGYVAGAFRRGSHRIVVWATLPALGLSWEVLCR